MSSAAVPEKAPDDSSKLKTFLSILRKFVGVTDIASVRFSLPAQLLEPRPNLEYWNYLDRPETFASIGKSDDELGRMLEVLRFWFTKDLKYIKGKPCKPYNSTLGEFFRCSWEVQDLVPEEVNLPGVPTVSNGTTVKGDDEIVQVCYLTEQTSHHPPVSAFYIDCPERGVSARGFDQISAKFTGTSIRVSPGQHNLGIFVNIEKRNEEYQLTHPHAHLGGLLRGALAITVSDACYMTCPKTRIKAILQYMEEGWIGRSQHRLEGVVFRYDPDDDNITKVKDVAESDVLARISGSWHGKIYYTPIGSKEPRLLIDITPLFPVDKILPPVDKQLSNESLKFWGQVTNAIVDKQFTEATRIKQEIEERQRQKAAERKEQAEEWKPRFFIGAVTPLGRPELTEEGRKALEGVRTREYALEESTVQGA
ncbi:Oxysterol-binding protein-like protein 1 [Penicillium macrosclerotiorum]|uniref:Oxysterol-binding protein-like protein 1 n=1 Tax=Penicillium macrosclerotiorum TaxID=303699 RepID=UPI00254901F2|nr:Oxysterol-binding protein-like protein 1 [Penicillium macrosclerotiorum]KAJ5692089.1 Oxysterol-binding protein-like protein 1 [Penicillium macrosclerotiorum]